MIGDSMIGIGGKAHTVETFWIGATGIRVSVVRFGVKARTGVSC